MSSKSYWEAKVSELLQPPYFPWRHKCPDAPHGGQAKLDFYVLNNAEHFGAIEVKYVKRVEPTFRVKWNKKGDEGPSPLQRQQLDLFTNIGVGSYIAVGHQRDALYFFEWSGIQNQDEVPLYKADFYFDYANKSGEDVHPPSTLNLWMSLW